MKNTIYFLIILIISIGCKDNSYDKQQYMEDGFTFSDGDLEADYDFSVQNNERIKPLEKTNLDSKIIKESHLRFETSSIEKTFETISSWLKQNKGFIQSDKTTKNYGNLERTMVIRIPTISFQLVIDSISNSVKVFDRKEISRRDVTEEFIDLEARLKSKRKLEARYLELLPQAKNVKEILEIEREIAKIREEIEAKQGRLKYLEDKVSLSTIYISFYEETNIEKSKSQTFFSRLIKAFKGGFTSVGEFFIGLLYVWPFILIGVFILVFIRKRLRRKKAKTNKS